MNVLSSFCALRVRRTGLIASPALDLDLARATSTSEEIGAG
jgi:hypothetical protein